MQALLFVWLTLPRVHTNNYDDFAFQMRDMNHENVNHFVGLCTDAPKISFAMVYCFRRSILVIQITSAKW